MVKYTASASKVDRREGGCMDKWVDEPMDGRTDRWMDVNMDGWMEGREGWRMEG